MAEVIFTDLGYFNKSDCEAIKKEMQGGSFMNFDVSYSNYAGNCTLIVRTASPDISKEELRGQFLWSIISKFSDMLNNKEVKP